MARADLQTVRAEPGSAVRWRLSWRAFGRGLAGRTGIFRRDR